MKIRIRSGNFKFFLPVPTALAGAAIKVMPQEAFRAMSKDIPPPYAQLICKETFLLIYETCREIFIEQGVGNRPRRGCRWNLCIHRTLGLNPFFSKNHLRGRPKSDIFIITQINTLPYYV